LRNLTLRLGDEETLLVALEVEGAEPPELEVDFPVSVALRLPDRTAVTLIGDPALDLTVKDRPFRISPWVDFPPNPAAAGLIIDVVLELAALSGNEVVLETSAGAGLLTAFLGEAAAGVLAIEENPDAVADLVANLHDLENVVLYQGREADILPGLEAQANLIIAHPSSEGLSGALFDALGRLAPSRFIYVSHSLAAFARDARRLSQLGYALGAVQPIDTTPHHFRIDTVTLWGRASSYNS
jgi:23S rRNA (uracil1939-C5)-methyltransferase